MPQLMKGRDGDDSDLGGGTKLPVKTGAENDSELPEGMVISFQSLAAEGDILAKQGDFRKAIDAYSKALAMRPTEKNVLVARSKCFLQMGDSQSALEDANMALKHDPEFFKGVFQKAEALYAKGDFEMALVYYHRGNKFRPELDEFRLGIQKAREAIDNSIGNPKDYKFQPPSSVRPMTAGAVPTSTTSGGANIPNARATIMAPGSAKESYRREGSAASHKSDKVLLGELYSDKIYLESLLNDKDFVHNPNDEICSLVSEALNYLETRTEFWRQQKPIYARRKEYSKVQAKAISDRNRDLIHSKANQFLERHPDQRRGKFDVEDEEPKKERPSSSKPESLKAINASMNVINGAIERGDLQDALKSAKSLLTRLNNMAGLDNRERAISDVLSTIGNIYLEMDNLPQAMQHHRKDLSLSRSHGMVDCISRALGNIGRTCVRLKRFEEAITSFEKKLVLTPAGTLERAWLLHDIGRCNLELGSDDTAILKANECLAIAEALKDKRWALNAHVLAAQAEGRSGRISQSISEYTSALLLANDLHDARATEAITQAMELTKAGPQKTGAMKAKEPKKTVMKTRSVSAGSGVRAGPSTSRFSRPTVTATSSTKPIAV